MLLMFVPLLLLGCQPVQTSQFLSAAGTVKLNGRVYGGQQPVSGASVGLYAVGTSGPGSPAQALLSQTVLTDSNGKFNLSGLYTCPTPEAQVFLTARGGNPGLPPGSTNPNIALMAVLGTCADLNTTTFVNLNEQTTVGAIWPLATFMSSPTEVGSAAGDPLFGDAVLRTKQLVNVATGAAPGSVAVPGYTVQITKINHLADILASCINSSGGVAGDGTACGRLFAATTPAGDSAPTDTVTAALRIAQNPAQNVSALFDAVAPYPPFQPTLSSAPADWSLDFLPIPVEPTISPMNGSYSTTQTVTIADSTAGAVVHYTVDGSIPNETSAVYSGPFTVTGGSKISAVAVLYGMVSSVATSSISIAAPAAPVPTHLAFVAQPTTVVAGTQIFPAVTVEVLDSQNKLCTQVTGRITLAVSSGDSTGTLAGTLSQPVSGGIASFSDLTLSAAGTNSLLASSAGLSSVTSSSFEVTAAPAPINLVTAIWSDRFVDSIGLNVHFSYLGSVYTSQTAAMVQDIQTLGIRHLRDQMDWEGTNGSPFYTVHNELGNLGVKTDYILTSISYPMNEVATYPSLVNDMEAVEATNEYDASGDNNWAAKIKAQQTQLYAQIHGAVATENMTVISPSLAQPQNASALGGLSSIADAGNSHAYFGGWNPGNSGTGGQANPSYFMRYAQVNTGSKPVWVTETGVWSDLENYWGGSGTGEAVMALYEPRTLLEFWLAGATRIYLYELADYSSNVYFGLLRQDGSKKPAFSSIANLLTLLADKGSGFSPGGLSYGLSGSTGNVHQILMEKQNGTFYLLLWVETAAMNPGTLQSISVPTQTVQVTLGSQPSSLTQYHLGTDGSLASSTLTPSESVSLPLDGGVTILAIGGTK